MSQTRFLFLITALLLASCSKYPVVIEPLNVSLRDQRVVSEFFVARECGCMFSLAFVLSDDAVKNRELGRFLSNETESDTIINLKLMHDGKLFFDQDIQAGGVSAYAALTYDGKKKAVAKRFIKFLQLAPGKYAVEVKVLKGVRKLHDVEVYLHMTHSDPKA